MADQAIILFDGVCNLCSSSVQFVLARDAKGHFKFASLQSDTGAKYIEQFGLPKDYTESVLLVENGKLYQSSSAALRIARNLDGIWPMFYVFIILPPFIRDFFYKIIANNRYNWFGKSDSCWLPEPKWASRFIS